MRKDTQYWCQVSDPVKQHLEPYKKCSCMKATRIVLKWNRNPTCIIFVVSVERSMSEVYRTHTGVIMPVTARGHASMTMIALRLSVMQMYTRVGTVKAAVALMRPRWLTSWHCCWMHKCLQIHHAAMSDGSAYYSVNYCKSDCSLYKCWYRPVCLEGTY